MSEPPSFIYIASEFDKPRSGMYGSRPPEGAKLLNESAAGRAGGDKDLLLRVGDGFNTAGVVSTGGRSDVDLSEADVVLLTFTARIGPGWELGSILAMGEARRFLRNLE